MPAVHPFPAAAVAQLSHALVQTIQRSAEARYVHHLHAVLMVAQGDSIHEVAERLACNVRSVERWVRAFRRDGIQGLRSRPCFGRLSSLTAGQVQQLRAELDAAPVACGYPFTRWSGKLVARHLAEHHGRVYSLRHCLRLLRMAASPP